MSQRKYYGSTIVNDKYNRPVKAMTYGQNELVKAIDKYDILFVNGPAGTGKSYLSLCKAVQDLKDSKYDRISLTRPIVTSGEEMGFLPGDLDDKLRPYMKPLYDNLDKLISTTTDHNPDKSLGKHIHKDKKRKGKKPKYNDEFDTQEYSDLDSVDDLMKQIEISPLAYIRGATLDKSFIILDECQNITKSQMKLFLTRMGKKSKMILAGDITQTDLPTIHDSGFKQAQELLHDVDGVGIITMTNDDIVRHKLVRDIIKKYDSINSHRHNTYSNHDIDDIDEVYTGPSWGYESDDRDDIE